jgi:hypothetical protein
MIALNFYLYGDQAAGTVARETPLWQPWLQKHFPMPMEPTSKKFRPSQLQPFRLAAPALMAVRIRSRGRAPSFEASHAIRG